MQEPGKFKTQYCPLCFIHLCYCFGLHRSEASIVQWLVKYNGQYWVFKDKTAQHW